MQWALKPIKISIFILRNILKEHNESVSNFKTKDHRTFSDYPLDVPILNQRLEDVNDTEEAGVELVKEVPDEPYLLISDAVWFSTELVRLFRRVS